ncbi:lipid-binding protein [uncultured Lutibacter sp.]|uniref:lipid-binding protein n=1 Tax=uncultured Lutibacter sp. TaxID=437739 RepID=UPI00263077CC|nr:lipid-binding protein [uncultured Lutibacter sp.]
MKYIKLLILGLLLVTACSPNEGYEDYPVEKLSLSEVASDWWVIALEPDGVTPAFGGDYVLVTTYNTGDNDGKTMFIDDHQNFFEFKTKIDVNLSDKTFTGKDNVELYYDGEILLSNGSITKSSYITTSGTAMDEIYFEAEFDWYAGTTFIFKGHKRSGFLQDENPNY